MSWKKKEIVPFSVNCGYRRILEREGIKMLCVFFSFFLKCASIRCVAVDNIVVHACRPNNNSECNESVGACCTFVTFVKRALIVDAGRAGCGRIYGHAECDREM